MLDGTVLFDAWPVPMALLVMTCILGVASLALPTSSSWAPRDSFSKLVVGLPFGGLSTLPLDYPGPLLLTGLTAILSFSLYFIWQRALTGFTAVWIWSKSLAADNSLGHSASGALTSLYSRFHQYLSGIPACIYISHLVRRVVFRIPPAANPIIALQASAIAQLQASLEAASRSSHELRRRLVAYDERNGRFLERMDALHADGTLKAEKITLLNHMLEQTTGVIDDKDLALRERDTKLARITADLVSLESVAKELRTALDAARAEAAEKNSLVAEKGRLYENMRAALDGAHSSGTPNAVCSDILKELEARACALDAQVQGTRDELAANKVAVDQLKDALDTALFAIAEKEKMLAEKDQMIIERNVTISEKASIILENERVLLAKDATIVSLDANARVAQVAIDESRVMVAEKDALLQNLTDERDVQNEIIASLKLRISSLEGDVSDRCLEMSSIKSKHHDEMEDALARKSDLEAKVIELEATVTRQAEETTQSSELLAAAHAETATLSRMLANHSDMLQFAASQMQSCKANNISLTDKNERLEVDLELRNVKIRKLQAQLLAAGVPFLSLTPKASQGQRQAVPSSPFSPTPQVARFSADSAILLKTAHVNLPRSSSFPDTSMSPTAMKGIFEDILALNRHGRSPLASTSSHNIHFDASTLGQGSLPVA